MGVNSQESRFGRIYFLNVSEEEQGVLNGSKDYSTQQTYDCRMFINKKQARAIENVRFTNKNSCVRILAYLTNTDVYHQSSLVLSPAIYPYTVPDDAFMLQRTNIHLCPSRCRNTPSSLWPWTFHPLGQLFMQRSSLCLAVNLHEAAGEPHTSP